MMLEQRCHEIRNCRRSQKLPQRLTLFQSGRDHLGIQSKDTFHGTFVCRKIHAQNIRCQNQPITLGNSNTTQHALTKVAGVLIKTPNVLIRFRIVLTKFAALLYKTGNYFRWSEGLQDWSFYQ
jgi:hypothetical protein